MGRVVFLDWGGTLVASLRDPFPVYASVLAQRGIAATRPAFVAAWSRLPPENAATAREYLGRTDEYWRRWDARALRELGVPDLDGSVGDALREAFRDPKWHVPFPEVEPALHRLRANGHSLHIVSNNTEDLHAVLQRLGWDPLYGSVTISQETGAEKPDPAIFQLALRRAGAAPSEVLHVGDSWEADVVGARRAGIAPAWLNRDLARGGERDVPTIRSLTELEPLLGGDEELPPRFRTSPRLPPGRGSGGSERRADPNLRAGWQAAGDRSAHPGTRASAARIWGGPGPWARPRSRAGRDRGLERSDYRIAIDPPPTVTVASFRTSLK